VNQEIDKELLFPLNAIFTVVRPETSQPLVGISKDANV
jgi:hypothetical protein